MADYATQFAQESAPAVMADRVRRTRAIYQNLGPWIDKYKGGMPKGFAAAAIQWESDGIATTPGDPNLGEYGYYQVTAEFPTTIGLPAAARFDNETNVFLGLMDYQIAVARLVMSTPGVKMGTADSWKLARLAFSIGGGGTQALLARAGAWRAPAPGKVYDNVVAFVDAGGARATSSDQPADVVWYRVKIVDLVWQIGQQAVPLQSVGSPTLVPSPPAGPYTLPASVQPYFTKPIPLAGIAVVSALGYLGYRALRRL